MEYAAAFNRLELHGPNDVLRAALDKAAVDLDQAAHAFCDKLDFARFQATMDEKIDGKSPALAFSDDELISDT